MELLRLIYRVTLTQPVSKYESNKGAKRLVLLTWVRLIYSSVQNYDVKLKVINPLELNLAYFCFAYFATYHVDLACHFLHKKSFLVNEVIRVIYKQNSKGINCRGSLLKTFQKGSLNKHKIVTDTLRRVRKKFGFCLKTSVQKNMCKV